jgi:hypothetical protein
MVLVLVFAATLSATIIQVSKLGKDLAVKRTGTYLGEEMYTSEGISVVKGSARIY